MIIIYPEIPAVEVTRAGEIHVFCDAEGCDKRAKVPPTQTVTRFVEGVEVPGEYAPMPAKWVTSDPDNNALAGAADFCEAHVSILTE